MCAGSNKHDARHGWPRGWRRWPRHGPPRHDNTTTTERLTRRVGVFSGGEGGGGGFDNHFICMHQYIIHNTYYYPQRQPAKINSEVVASSSEPLDPRGAHGERWRWRRRRRRRSESERTARVRAGREGEACGEAPHVRAPRESPSSRLQSDQ